MEIITDPKVLALVPIIVGLVQIAKGLNLPSAYAPLLSIFLGVGLTGLVTGFVIESMILGGLVIGLSASGLYSGVKASLE